MDNLVTDHQGIADKGEETRSPLPGALALSRKELGKLFNVSHEAIRIWEENGKLIKLGWERVGHSKSPVKYRRCY